MDDYRIAKPLYNARRKRVLYPGEIMQFDLAQAQVLIRLGLIIPVDTVAVEEEKLRKRIMPDYELEKLIHL